MPCHTIFFLLPIITPLLIVVRPFVMALSSTLMASHAKTVCVQGIMARLNRVHYCNGDPVGSVRFNPDEDKPQPIGYGATISAPHMVLFYIILLLYS
jgi:protein-L-isoaspartate O-methyltransferase